MTNEQMIKVLQQIENEITIENFEYKGINFWPLLRTYIYTQNSSKNNGAINPESADKKLVIQSIISSFFDYFIDSSQHSFPKKSDVYFLTSSNSRVEYNRKQIDTFFSPLIEWSDKSYHMDELVPLNDYRTPRYEKTSYIQWAIYRNYIKAYFTKNKKYAIKWINALEAVNTILKTYNSNIFVDINSLLLILERIFLLSDWFTKRLNIIQPKCVMVMCYYSTSCYALLHAANTMGIKTIDMQHGVQGCKHIAYSKFNKIPSNGWHLLPKLFWNWTQIEADYINSWGNGFHAGFNGGIVWHAYLEDSVKCTDISDINIHNKPCVLVSLQPLSNNENFISQLLSVITSDVGKDFCWLIRLHPAMVSEVQQFEEIFNFPHCNVNAATNIALPILLSNIVLHITRYSSVVIECATLSVKSLVEHEKNCFDASLSNHIRFYDKNLHEVFSQIVDETNCEKNVTTVDSKSIWLNLDDVIC